MLPDWVDLAPAEFSPPPIHRKLPEDKTKVMRDFAEVHLWKVHVRRLKWIINFTRQYSTCNIQTLVENVIINILTPVDDIVMQHHHGEKGTQISQCFWQVKRSV